LSYGFIDAIHAGPRERDAAFGHRGQQGVERVFRCPVELLDVEEPALAHRLKQRPVDEVAGAVILAQHPGRVVVPDDLGRRQARVALNEHQRDAPSSAATSFTGHKEEPR
jgi:hypothetical protein